MKRCAIVIGINKTGLLPPLTGAVQGAKDFSNWAKSQNIDTVELTDETEPVKVQDILLAIKDFVDKRTYGQMIIFFSGHGILKSANDEYWLLSEAPVMAHEAVNLTSSWVMAKKSGIPHVVFISDACRTNSNEELLMEVTGLSVFPNLRFNNTETVIDILYATRPGKPSFEVKPDSPTNKPGGIYTNCLSEGLRGRVPTIIKAMHEDGMIFKAIPAYELNEHLKVAVQQAAANVNIELEQIPDGIITSRDPKHLARVRDSFSKVYPNTSPPILELKTPPPPSKDSIQDLLQSNSTVREFHNKLLEAKGRQSFETQTGFTIIGDLESRVFKNTVTHDRFVENNSIQIRVFDDPKNSHTLLLQLGNNNIVPLAILESFIGTVVINKGEVINVDYTPSANSNKFQMMDRVNSELEERRAIVATSARLGIFQFKGNMYQAIESASYLRNLKAFDPTLGLYSAYGYAQANDFSDVRSILSYMLNEKEAVLFDVYMLSLIDNDEIKTSDFFRPRKGNRVWNDNSIRSSGLAPFCPALTQGWSWLPVTNLLTDNIQKLGKYLVPGLWTTFNKKGVAKIENMLNEIL